MLAINWAHPYNHREERLFNLFFGLLFDLNSDAVGVALRTRTHAHTHFPSLFQDSDVKESEKKQARATKMALFIFLFDEKKRDILYISKQNLYNFFSPHGILFNCNLQLRDAGHLLNAFSNRWQNIYISCCECVTFVVSLSKYTSSAISFCQPQSIFFHYSNLFVYLCCENHTIFHFLH